MSRILSDRGLILRCVDYSETSVVMTVFMREHGRTGLMVKGARRKVKNGSALIFEPCYEIEAVYYDKPGRELRLAKELSLTDSHYALRGQLERMTYSAAMTELLLRCLHDDDPHEALYDQTVEALRLLESVKLARPALLWKFELVLLECLGVLTAGLPDGTEIAGNGNPVLSPESQAVLKKLSASTFELSSRLTASAQAAREITHWFEHYFLTHLPVSGKLRSLDALRWTATSPQ